ncbi:MAG: enoyl-CoA hydratase [Blastopirellula sp.]|nr:MAG: enoyl-CoA hydratase [Blastopirellula sp.]
MIKMSEPSILVKKHVPSGTIVLNRPDKRNALSRNMIADLEQALRDFHGEKKVRAVIITGAGSAFCAGLDLSEMHETCQSDEALQKWHEDSVQLRELYQYMLRFPKPIIAAVNGPAVGAGAGLVLASDIVIAAKEATFGFPEPQRGIVSGLCAPLLTFRIGGGHAAKLLLTAERISADRAQQIGLFEELVSHDLLWARAAEICKTIEKSAAEAVSLTKRVLNETIGEHLEMLLAAGAAASATSKTTQAASEGLSAFVEKREPNWP